MGVLNPPAVTAAGRILLVNLRVKTGRQKQPASSSFFPFLRRLEPQTEEELLSNLTHEAAAFLLTRTEAALHQVFIFAFTDFFGLLIGANVCCMLSAVTPVDARCIRF